MTDKDFALTHFFKKISSEGSISLELYLTSECNLKCNYCYLRNHEELYPFELRNHAQISQNLDILFETLLEKKLIHFRAIDVFSGEIWGTSFGKEVLEKIYVFAKKANINSITIPSNMTFLLDDESKLYYENLISKARKEEIYIIFSQSFDGILEDDNRKSSQALKRNESYQQKLKEWYNKYDFLFHPMISANGIEKWIDNMNFFKTFLEKNTYTEVIKDVMCLEVRDDNWTSEKLTHYVKLQKFLFDKIYEENENNITEFLKLIFYGGYSQTNPIAIRTNLNRIACSIQQVVSIRLGDLAWVPCHRTSYPLFIYGFLNITKDNFYINENNLQMATTIYGISPEYAMPKCEHCKLASYCMKQCLGSQYESQGDLFEPNPTVCDLYQTKIVTMYELLKSKNIFNNIQEITEDHLKQTVLNFKLTVEAFLNKEEVQ